MAVPFPIVRAGPSGKRLVPVDPLGTRSWNAGAPLVLELAKAGHEAGLYTFTIGVFPIVAAGGGTLTIAATYDTPGVGAVSINYATASALNNGFIAPRNIISSGRSAIVLTLTPASVTGSPVFYVNCPLDFISGRLPASYPS